MPKLYLLTYLILKTDLLSSYYYHFHLTKRNLRLKKTNQLAQGHTATKWWSQNLNTASMDGSMIYAANHYDTETVIVTCICMDVCKKNHEIHILTQMTHTPHFTLCLVHSINNIP